jgi:hypothetical protein
MIGQRERKGGSWSKDGASRELVKGKGVKEGVGRREERERVGRMRGELNDEKMPAEKRRKEEASTNFHSDICEF